MPILLKKNITDQVAIAVWEIRESLEELLDECSMHDSEQSKFSAISNEGRKKQWLSTRLALRELSGRDDLLISNKEDRSPYLNDENRSISISHTSRFVAVILGHGENLGVDIEELNPRILKIRHRFCSDNENLYLDKAEDLLSSLYVIWSAKETLFKIYGKGNLDFRKNLDISPFTFNPPDSLNTRIDCQGLNESIELAYEQIDNHILVYGISDLK